MHDSVDHQSIITTLIGIISAMAAWGISVMGKRIDGLEKKHDELVERITDTEITFAKSCMQSDELRAMRGELFRKLNEISEKIDGN